MGLTRSIEGNNAVRVDGRMDGRIETRMPRVARVAAPGFLACLICLPASSIAATNAPAAPLAVAYSTPLPAGKIRVSYQIEASGRKGYRKGDSQRSVSDLTQYSDVPHRIEKQIHTFGFDYAPWERLTLSLKLPFVHNTMHVTRKSPDPGADYSNNSSGLGDIRVALVVPFMKKGNERLHFYLEGLAPTGRTDERGRIRSNRARDLLPYSMQPGSGTWGVRQGFGYLGHVDWMGWGVAGNVLFRFGKNDQGYRLGNRYDVSAWLSRELMEGLGASLRLSWDQTDNVHGRSRVGPASNPDSDGYNQGGAHLDLGPGITLAIPALGEQRLSVEAVWPLYQDLNGIQLERDWTLRAGWNWAF